MAFVDALKSRNALIEKIGLSDAHFCMGLSLLLEEPDVDLLASEGLVDGGGDKKIDFIYHDLSNRKLVFAQGFYSSKQKDEAPANKASDLNTACAWLLSGDLALVPERLRGPIEGFRKALDFDEIDSIELVYVHNLPESVNVSRELQTVEAHLRATLKNDRVSVRAQELGSSKLEALFSARDSHIEVTETIKFPAIIGLEQSGDKWTAGVATVQALWLHELYQKHGDKLYSANYRGFLGADGRKRVNSGIRETAEKQPKDFWAFNNGITILTLGMEVGKDKAVYLKGISIINGAQTSGTLGSIDITKVSLRDVNVLCRVIECSDQATIDSIVRFNNTQNAITTWFSLNNAHAIDFMLKHGGFSRHRLQGFL